MDALSALRLQLEWGVDEALEDAPQSRFQQTAAVLPPPTQEAGAKWARELHARQPATSPTPITKAPADLQSLTTLAALQAALDAFQACPLRATASHTVGPSGNPDAGLVFIAEAPAADDDRSGQAYSGTLGQTVDRVLASAGLGRDTALLAFLVPWRPPGGRQLNETEVALCLPFAHRLIAITRPRHVVLLGGWALRALAGDAGGIRQARGRWTEIPRPGSAPVRALPMLPPDTWLKSPANRQNTWNDLLALRSDLTTV